MIDRLVHHAESSPSKVTATAYATATLPAPHEKTELSHRSSGLAGSAGSHTHKGVNFGRRNGVNLPTGIDTEPRAAHDVGHPTAQWELPRPPHGLTRQRNTKRPIRGSELIRRTARRWGRSCSSRRQGLRREYVGFAGSTRYSPTQTNSLPCRRSRVRVPSAAPLRSPAIRGVSSFPRSLVGVDGRSADQPGGPICKRAHRHSLRLRGSSRPGSRNRSERASG